MFFITTKRREKHLLKISKEYLEVQQIKIYVIAIVAAVLLGVAFPKYSLQLDKVISLTIAILLYSMFRQIPFLQIKKALSNWQFIKALLTINYIFVPLLVWLLAQFLSSNLF